MRVRVLLIWCRNWRFQLQLQINVCMLLCIIKKISHWSKFIEQFMGVFIFNWKSKPSHWPHTFSRLDSMDGRTHAFINACMCSLISVQRMLPAYTPASACLAVAIPIDDEIAYAYACVSDVGKQKFRITPDFVWRWEGAYAVCLQNNRAAHPLGWCLIQKSFTANTFLEEVYLV